MGLFTTPSMLIHAIVIFVQYLYYHGTYRKRVDNAMGKLNERKRGRE